MKNEVMRSGSGAHKDLSHSSLSLHYTIDVSVGLENVLPGSAGASDAG